MSVIDVDGVSLVEPIDAGDTAAVETMTVAFATLTARRDGALADAASLFGGAMIGPIVVVTGAIAETDAAALAPIVAHTSLPVLLSVGGEPGGLATARTAGWRVSTLEPEDELARLWGPAMGGGVRVG